MHMVEYHGNIIETTVTNKASVARNWMRNVSNSLKQNGENGNIVGIGCKYIHHPITSMSNKIAILQLCVDTKCLILQLLHINRIPDNIRVFLHDPNVTFIGVEVHANLRKLLEEYAIEVNRKVDVHFLAKRWFPMRCGSRPSIKALAYDLLGLPMRKRRGNCDCECDWESRVLDEELVEQACIDVYVSYSIAHMLVKDDCV